MERVRQTQDNRLITKRNEKTNATKPIERTQKQQIREKKHGTINNIHAK